MVLLTGRFLPVFLIRHLRILCKCHLPPGKGFSIF